ncbi:hypothetical protein Y032_0453g1721 [Ancylostoma ceylanicum]|uniref:Uncharacterized protein n=1 Tax=Ancylostoma ceylanicum TaxID=53326 RepID=A0A016WYG9_9BILA|nr:hypothetical protein Y032_0453g1721 [Ancylostoma ceylanicum]
MFSVEIRAFLDHHTTEITIAGRYEHVSSFARTRLHFTALDSITCWTLEMNGEVIDFLRSHIFKQENIPVCSPARRRVCTFLGSYWEGSHLKMTPFTHHSIISS